MYIANPIYDVVFKYLMENKRIAKKLISAIIGEDVEELEFVVPHESVPAKEKKPVLTIDKESYTVCRVDFIARIKTNGIPKVVIIEVKKAKFSQDILRLRKYLKTQYLSSSNGYVDDAAEKHGVMQIYCIFFFVEDLGIDGVPVLEIDNCVKDRAANVELTGLKNEFIDSLHHRSWIVQIPELSKHRRNDLEIMLSVFAQRNTINDSHILNVKEDDFPKEFMPIVRRLQMAVTSHEIRETMIGEDFYLAYFQNQERLIEKKDKIIEENDKLIAEKDKLIEKKNKLIEEKNKALPKKDEILQEKDDALQEKEEVLQEKDKLIAELMRKINNQ